MSKIRCVAFDADDTLWHNERVFKLSQERFAELLSDFADPKDLDARLVAAERRNLGHYGFGVKGFVLSMIETAIDVTDQRVPADIIQDLIDMGQDMLAHPIELLPHAQTSVTALAASHQILLVTKGDLLDQERKLAQSGLGDLFDGVEIVSDKTPEVYARIFSDTDGGIGSAMMVGNSMKSDVRPAIDIGAWGVFVPHELEWDFEKAEPPSDQRRFRQIDDLGMLPDLIQSL